MGKEYTIKEYERMEVREPATKFEFLNGEIIKMAGGSVNHAKAISNLFFEIQLALRNGGKPCQAFTSDARIGDSVEGFCFHPDITVVCGTPAKDYGIKETIGNPLFICEVLSPSTAEYDKSEKFQCYRKFESFKEYMIVSPEEQWVSVFSRTYDGHWNVLTYLNAEDTVQLFSLGISVRMDKIFPDESHITGYY